MTWPERRVLVIGAGSGIGAKVARRFVELGAQVVEADIGGRDWLARDSSRVAVDVTVEASVDNMVKLAVKRFGGLDIVVNCAGILGSVQPSHDVSMSEFELICRVNLYGSFAISKAAIPVLLKSSSGRLIHIASIAGKDGNPQMAAYSASKAGLIGLVKALGKEYARTRLTINGIAPASIETPMIEAMSESRRAVQKDLAPMGRFGTTDEAAKLIEFIASDASSFTTGFIFDLSGGRADY